MKQLIRSLPVIAAMAAAPAPAISAEDEVGNVEPHPVVLINVFQVPEGSLDETVVFWEAARDFLKDQPGYLSTALHRSLLPDARFQLVNIARWENAEAFRNATAAMRTDAGLKPVEGLTFDAALYEIIRSD